jgi:hypothetical protein
MQITQIEYDVVMQALNNAKAEIHDDEFIDPYSEFADLYTNEQLAAAIDSFEEKLFIINPHK